MAQTGFSHSRGRVENGDCQAQLPDSSQTTGMEEDACPYSTSPSIHESIKL